MEDSRFNLDDYVFEDEEEVEELSGDFSEGDKVIINGQSYQINESVKAKKVGSEEAPAIYSWYKAKDEKGDLVNLFFYDSDIDSVEKNDKVAEDWFNQYGE